MSRFWWSAGSLPLQFPALAIHYTVLYMSTAELCASLFAHPAGHSLSPALHHAALAAVGWSGSYRAEDISPKQLPARIAALRTAAVAGGVVYGANLSLPHKVAALPLLDGLTPAAREIGAVNTLFFRGAQLHGDNTDALGLRAALLEAGYRPQPQHQVVLLGAGGAARAALWVLREWSVPTLILARTPHKAQALAQEWAQVDWLPRSMALTSASEVDWSQIGLILNASSAGLERPEQTPLPLGTEQWRMLPPDALVYDMVYRPAVTGLMRDAQAQGVRTAGGLGMLAHQAALAFERWTGERVAVQVMLQAAAATLTAEANA